MRDRTNSLNLLTTRGAVWYKPRDITLTLYFRVRGIYGVR